MKLTATPLERPSRAKRQGLHYHYSYMHGWMFCPNTSQHWCSIWLDKQHIWWDIVLCPTVIFHTAHTKRQKHTKTETESKVIISDMQNYSMGLIVSAMLRRRNYWRVIIRERVIVLIVLIVLLLILSQCEYHIGTSIVIISCFDMYLFH